MSQRDIGIVTALTLLAVLIWVRDITWITAAADTLPILIALPLFYYFGSPWIYDEVDRTLPVSAIALGVIGYLVGIVANLTLLLAISWTWLLWTWVRIRFIPKVSKKACKLLILPIMAFPWVTLDATQVGWYFRLSGAQTTASLYSKAGANVIQEGTRILINGIPISVEAACSGLNTLQSMLIAGSIIAFIFLEKSRLFWLALPLLVAIAWVANTFRISVLTYAALAVSPEFALGAFHTWGGWLVIVTMFLLSLGVFSLMEKISDEKS